MQLARWWQQLSGERVECELCPRFCLLKPGQVGSCGARRNDGGHLISLVYGKPVALHVDPIEKKPLYHFRPGSRIFSLGTIGCNLQCSFCQNWDIARGKVSEEDFYFSPEQVITGTLKNDCQSIAFTYNEPTIFGEYVLDIAQLAQKQGLKTVMVTNGYISPVAIAEIYPYIDAANIDLKAFTEDFYARICHAHLRPVLDAIVAIKRQGTWIELTNLLIPGLNDAERDIRGLADWIVQNIGAETPLHFSAFHPDYRMLDRPPTSKATLDRARQIAQASGLLYVYEGNVLTGGEADTVCPKCQRLLIERRNLIKIHKNLNGTRCVCGTKIPLIN